MKKMCVYLTPDHLNTLMWYCKNTKKELSEVMKEAIDWFDPELHGPFVYASFARKSRVIKLPDNYMNAIKAYAEGYLLSNPKTASVIMWLYVTNNAEDLREVEVKDIPNNVPVMLSEDLYRSLDGNVSKKLNESLLDYYDKRIFETRKITVNKEKGVRRKRVNVYVKDHIKKLLIEMSNTMKAHPQHVAADALAETVGGELW